MSKNRPPFSLYETPHKLSVTRQPKTSAFSIVGSVVRSVDKAVRESDFALFAGRYWIIDSLSPHAEAGERICADIDDDSVWRGMVSELAAQWDVLPKSLESVSAEVSRILGRPVTVVSDQKLAKMAKDAERLAASAEKEAKRAEKRRQNKLARPSAVSADGTLKKPMVVTVIEKRLAKCEVSMRVYRYLDPTVTGEKAEPSLDDVQSFISTIERTTMEIAFTSGNRAMPVMRKLAELRALTLLAFPQAEDRLRPIVDAAVKKASKPIRQAENRA